MPNSSRSSRGPAADDVPLRLPPGATGSCADWSQAPTAAVERAFRAAAYHAARRTGGKVVGYTPVPMARSFRSVEIRYRDDMVLLCGHVLVPLIALRSLPLTRGDFRDDAELIRLLSEVPPNRALTRDELLTPLDDVDLSALSVSERREIDGWRKATDISTVGDVLFNDWD